MPNHWIGSPMSSAPRWKYGKPVVAAAVTPADPRKARAYMAREPTPRRGPRYDRGVIWEPFVLAPGLGPILSAGLYFAYLWPSVEPRRPDAHGPPAGGPRC